MLSPPLSITLTVTSVLALLFIVAYQGQDLGLRHAPFPHAQQEPILAAFSRHRGPLPIPSRTFVISLLRRQDRREDMERLRARLNEAGDSMGEIQWSFVDALEAASPLVSNILASVRTLRTAVASKPEAIYGDREIKLPFSWPVEDESTTLNPTTFWTDTARSLRHHTIHQDSTPLTCATENLTIPTYTPELPEWKILSRNRIAVWHSHFSTVRLAESLNAREDEELETATLILEDDVDMESDVRERLREMWPALPREWDIIFLGHCWSDETLHAPIYVSSTSHTALHPSNAPLCTHAYVLSPKGLRRLLWHLSHPPFSYSRAYDRAVAWLVQSGRMTGFSVVPSVVVQRKIGSSDVMSGTGSRWKDSLADGILDRL
ncbi:unnamed protein product [Mycena citricolor]|uniref:Glycosyltransferase family 25 protein n=1 Tax=Mycena citricolor TaxID=2018698 RepID=A0AAD2HNI2_9AGAR|nr:unnamed protein product [Mycena citricolor]